MASYVAITGTAQVMHMLLTELIGVVYLIGILAAVLVALTSSDPRRRGDALKVLSLLLSTIPQFSPRHPNGRTGPGRIRRDD
jgi:hypothetical protein